MGKILRNGKWDGIWDRPKYQEMRKKITESFKGLTFVEEGHKYFLGDKEFTCVSNVTHRFQEHFDSHTKAQETFERNFNNERSKYYRMTAAEIEKAWAENSKQACEHGSERHEFGESCYWYMTGQYDRILPAFKDRLTKDGGFEARFPKEEATVKFWEDLPVCFVPIAVENITYNKTLNYSGTFDMLFYYDAELDGKSPEKSGFVIFDYKTNKDLYKNFMGKKLLPPFDELLDMPCSLYKLQLSLYELNLEQLGFKVIARRLIWLKPDGEYDKIPLESYTKVLSEELTKHPII
jgi:hypothetical protein